jgi:hypothetical protein
MRFDAQDSFKMVMCLSVRPVKFSTNFEFLNLVPKDFPGDITATKQQNASGSNNFVSVLQCGDKEVVAFFWS